MPKPPPDNDRDGTPHNPPHGPPHTLPSVFHFEDSGTANTPLASNGLRVDYTMEVDRKLMEVRGTVTAVNFAVTDNAWGAVRLALLDSGNFEVFSTRFDADERCPARGLSGPTVRQGSGTVAIVPKDLKFTHVATVAINLDNPGNGTLDWGQLIEAGLAIIRVLA